MKTFHRTAQFIDITRTVFPVIALERGGEDGQMARADFVGTAFAVGPGVFMTAAGVVLGTDTVEYAGVAQHVGIVMTANQIAALHSPKLGGPIGNQLGFVKCVLQPPGDATPP